MMKEILITSSALILALLVLRQGFKGVLSRRVQYALWALVLVRLLVPVSLPAAEFSVLTATQPVQTVVAGRVAARPIYVPVEQQPLSQHPSAPDAAPEVAMAAAPTDSQVWVVKDEDTAVRYHKLSVEQVLGLVWKVGMAAMGGFFLLSNTAFYWRLRKNRREWAKGQDEVSWGGTLSAGCAGSSPGGGAMLELRRKVYLVPEGVVPSPCLFGRSIYITPAVAEDPARLRHVLTHELTHAKHWDPLWSLLRCLCLTVYWFDPLVWIAARCSKTDCELACDESVLKALGEAERIPYGQTLLSLIPVKRGGNPMIAATTMTAGKKQLKDRVKRIAHRPRQLVAAALAVAVLAGVVSACTFTGGTGNNDGKVPGSGPEALTGEELRWFNYEFFSPPQASSYNFRNQFANPGILYDRPEDIDLYELFYCEMGDGEISDDELAAFGYDSWEDMPCPAYKMTAGEMDRLLVEHTGRSLEETNKVGLEQFTYLEEYDAYYWMHGDTNYSGGPSLRVGTREDGLVKLYYTSDYASAGSWYCVTLVEAGGSGTRPYEGQGAEDPHYYFVSHQQCEAPAIPTPLPAGEPEAAISLRDLEPYIAPTVAVEPHTGDFDNSPENRLENWNIGGHNVVIYRSTVDGQIYAALRQEDGTMNVFLSLPDGYQYMFFFHNIFGRDGFTISYSGELSPHTFGTIVDYFYVNSDGVPVLLARTHNGFDSPQVMDLDGDGTMELCTEKQIFFQREGQLYLADLPELVQGALPQLDYWDSSSWDTYSKCLSVNGIASERNFSRFLYFDGENLLVYQDQKPTEDHMVVGADKDVPAEVVAAAKEFVSGLKWDEKDGTFANANYHHSSDARYDDWRIESFTGFYSEKFGETAIEGWAFNYELHTTTPEDVVLAGGRYLTEDNWVSPGYPGCDWLFFRLEGAMAEKRVFLFYSMINDATPGSVGFREMVTSGMERAGVEPEGTTYAALEVQAVMDALAEDDTAQLILTTADGVGGGAYPASSCVNLANRRLWFTQPGTFHWSRAEPPASPPAGTTLVFTDGDWYQMLQFWAGSDLVMSKDSNREGVWYRAEVVEENSPFDADIFSFMRLLFDEAEIERNIAISDHGNGPYEAAQAYLTLAEQSAHRNATPGSRFACTYVQVANIEILEDMPETWFPADILDYPHFAFSYDLIFVPENENALSYLMAGNTGEYEGSDPNVPQGAFQYSRRGSLYLVDGYWHCGGIGTG